MSARKMPLDKDIIEDYKTMSSGDMASKYGVARGTVCKHLRKLEITRPVSGVRSRNRKRKGEVLKSGYPAYHLPDHPRASNVGYVYKHILEMEKFLGRLPEKTEPIHHVDLDRTNYHISNLYLTRSHSHHQKVHASLYKCVRKLIGMGILKFNDGKYYI